MLFRSLFVNAFEYPLAAVAACFLLPAEPRLSSSHRSLVNRVAGLALTALPALLMAAAWWLVRHLDARVTNFLILGLPCLAAFALRRRPLRMGLSLALLVITGVFIRFDGDVLVHAERNFFGLQRVIVSGHEHVLISGTTNHGAQAIDPALACEPLTYYSRGGPVGQLLDALTADGTKTRFGVVGLGTASIAAYAKPDHSWTFFEINPAVERVARDPKYFTYLRDCAPQAQVVTGDARLMLASHPDASLDVLVLDAFSSDAIPVHLITREAFALYLRKLAPGGVIALHVSNSHLDLPPLIRRLSDAHDPPLNVRYCHDVPLDPERDDGKTESQWMLLGRTAADLAPIVDRRYTKQSLIWWNEVPWEDGPIWRDDFANLLRVWKKNTPKD